MTEAAGTPGGGAGSGPFSGLRVLELGQFIAVPYCAQLLADGGADVVKVEPLRGDQTRDNGAVAEGEGRQFLNKNRGKRSLAVDLGHPEARAAVRRLAARADVVLANFRPGLAEGMGLDHATVAAANPRVVYAENTAFGAAGPMAGAAGVDIALQAYSGIATLTADGPDLQPNPLVDYAAGLLMAWGVATALYHRERTGQGQRLDVALLQAALVLQNNQMIHVDAADGWREEYVAYLRTAFAEGATWGDVLAHRDALRPLGIIQAYYGIFTTADGAVAVGGAGLELQRAIARALEVDDPWVQDPAFRPDDPRVHVISVRAQVADRLSREPTDHWLDVLGSAGVPVAPVQVPEQLLDDPQAWANDFLVRLDHPVVGPYTAVAPPVRFSASPLAARGPSPVLGADTRAVLREAGLDHDAVDRLAASRAVREAGP